jgi:hypothetical protein
MTERGMSSADIDRVFTTDWCLRKPPAAAGAPAPAAAPVHPANTGGSKSGGVDGEDVTVFSDMWFDDNTEEYYAEFTYRWLDDDYSSDMRHSNYLCLEDQSIGGQDAFGVGLSGGEYQIMDTTAIIFGNPALEVSPAVDRYPTKHIGGLSKVSAQGVGFTYQDLGKDFCGLPESKPNHNVDFNLNMYHAILIMGFLPLNDECRNAQVFGEYIHTWDNTSVTGFGIAPWGFDVQWANQGHEQPFASYGPTILVCGSQ